MFVAWLNGESLSEAGQLSAEETAAQRGEYTSIQTPSPCRYYHMKSKAFSCLVLCWQTPEVLLTGDILGQLSTAKLGSEILSWKSWPAWVDFVKGSPLSCIFQNKKWGRDGLESAQGLQSYFPLISKPYGWISWNSWGSALHLAVFNRRNAQ